MRWLLTISLLCCMAWGQASTNVYVTPSGTAVGNCPAGTGSAPNFTAAQFSNPSNWGSSSGKIGPGSIILLCGGVTGAANSTILTFQGSGSSGNPITLRFDTSGATVSAPYCASSAGASAAGCITFGAGNSYLIIDGNNLAGTVQNTANGSSLANQQASTLISGFNCSHCTVENLNLLNAYINVNGNSTIGDSSVIRAIDPSGPSWTISGNVLSNCGWCVFSSYAANDTNEQYYKNTFTQFGHAFAFAAASGIACISPCFFIHDNDMNAGTNWDAPGCFAHKDGIHLFGNGSTSTMDGAYIYNNYFHGDWGTCPTGFVFSEAGGSDPGLKTWAVWNNVGIVVNTSFVNTNGWIGMFSGHSGTQKFLYNTIIGNGQNDNTHCFAIQDISASLTFEGNTASGCGNPVDLSSNTIAAADYNVYGANTCQNGGNCFVWNGSFEGSFAAWKTACSCDSHSISTLTPHLNADGSPQSNYVGILEGVNLGSIATGNLATLQNDTTQGNNRSSLARPASGTCSSQGNLPCWDIGAYQFAIATPPPAAASSMVLAGNGAIIQ